MKSFASLPDGYREIFAVDLQKDKTLALLVNLAAIGIGVLMAVPMAFVVPISTLFDLSEGLLAYVLRFVVMLAAYVLYVVLHEAVHGVAMKIVGTKNVKYGFTGLYAFAGSDEYYTKSAYIFIALAPVVLWGIVIAVIHALVPVEWFWVVYFVQIGNNAGAAGDYYVTLKFSRMPNDILVRDHGVGMNVYSQMQDGKDEEDV